ncbi:hypothetical protein JQK15_03910 [Sphingobium sp. BHU LFT2]|uniref:hypothetical protein n=1 Tax=Sphingobium sp. BHU LFT2 TaxID=2807634 RepID=UPI001BECFA05|nr:hypothetical protein [Sphingobium sp. BHU LFT2]MBT2242674.1 hypothetical protein [Sphingobium sp. BHU LFT2]
MEQDAAMKEVPRRLCVDDADYDPQVGESLIVSLDGVDQYGQATAYDLDAGTVTRVKRDEKGLILINGDEVVLETVSGDVDVRWRP